MSGLFKKFAIPLLSLTVLLIIPTQVNAFSDVVSYQGRAFSGSSFVNPGCYSVGFRIARFLEPVGPENAGNPKTTQRIIPSTDGQISSFRNSHPIQSCSDGKVYVENGLFNVLLNLSNFQQYLSTGTYYGISISFDGSAYSAWQPLSAAAVSLLSNRLAGVGMYTNNVTGSGINGSIAFDAAPTDWVGIYGENAGTNYSRLILATGDDNGQDEIRFRSQGWAANGANAPIDYLVSNSNRFDITSGSLISKKGGAYANGGLQMGNHSFNSSPTDGWLYLLNSSWTTWDATGLAAGSLSAKHAICLNGSCISSWPTPPPPAPENHGKWVFSGENLYANGSGNIYTSSGTLSISANLQNSGNLSVTGSGVVGGTFTSSGNLTAPTLILSNGGPSITKDPTVSTRLYSPNDFRANNLVANDKLYVENSANTYLGPGINKDLSLISKKPGQWLRIGSEDTIAFWGRPGAESNNDPDLKIDRSGIVTVKDTFGVRGQVEIGGNPYGWNTEFEARYPDTVNGRPNLWLTALDAVRAEAPNGFYINGSRVPKIASGKVGPKDVCDHSGANCPNDRTMNIDYSSANFSSPPVVTVTLEAGTSAETFGFLSAPPTRTGAQVEINTNTLGVRAYIHWIAVGQ